MLCNSFVWILYPLIVLLLGLTNRTLALSISTQEYNALADLYFETNGPSWLWMPVETAGSEWNFTSGSDPCIDHWQGLGCNFVEADQAHVVWLNLSDYGIIGPLSASIGNLTYLTVLKLDANGLTGTIPATVGTGFTCLKSIILGRNSFIGSIPSSIATLTCLEELELFDNKLTGSIPATLGASSDLQVVDVSYNRLHGPIPPPLWTTTMQQVILRNNELTGTIPAIPQAARSLLLVDLASNDLSGTVPDFPNTLSTLQVLVVYFNKFTGWLPSSICGLSALSYMDFGGNGFTGPLNECFFHMSNLTVLLLNGNAFSGPVPTSFSSLAQLRSIWLQVNQFSGPVPNFSGMHNLSELQLFDNQITGTIPDITNTVNRINVIGFEINYITGTIPSVLGLSELQILNVANNLLTGSLPTSLSTLPHLIIISVNNNFLGGTLDGVFDSTAQISLESVEINDNRITGALPDELFQLPALTTVLAQSNCVRGTLPPTVCSCETLQSLVLDGLHTSSACRTTLVSAAHSYILKDAFHGTVPQCIFALPSLITLHMSGNALTGTIPDTTIGDRLENLVLSHNALTGTVPDAIQAHNWRYLDLSYNRITGILQSSFGAELGTSSEIFGNISVNSTDNTVILENNRLSGKIPTSLLDLDDVSILGSNRFACKIDKSDLPRHDSDRNRYQCASNIFDIPYYVYLALVVLVAIAFGLCWRFAEVPDAVKQLLVKWRLDPSQTPRNISYVFTALSILSQISVLCTALIILVLAPLYLIENTSFGTYTHKYAWMVSAAYLSGVEPFAIEFTLYCLLMVLLVVATGVLIVRKDEEERVRSRSSARISRTTSNSSVAIAKPPLWKRALIYMAFLSVNIFVVVGANLTFVYLALTQSNGVVLLAQLLLSVFKLMWNTVCTPFLTYIAAIYLSQSQSRAGITFVTVQVFIGLFNNIAIPCFVVAAVNPSCFYSIFVAPEPVHATVRVSTCLPEPLFLDCGRTTVITSSYEPPFHYDYQCSSIFITYYAPTFVYLGMVAGVLSPIAKVFAMSMLQRSREGSTAARFWRKFVPRILAPVSATTLAQAHRTSEHSVDTVGRSHLSVDTAGTSARAKDLWSSYNPYFDANNLIISVIVYLGILLTFGVVFPPLAFVMCITILSVIWQARLEVGRFIHNAQERAALHLVDLIEQECRGAISVDKLRRSMFAIVTFCCSFYAMFLFDTLGDAVGLYHAYWVLIVMPLVPFCIFAAVAARRRWLSKTGGPKLGMSIDVDLYELSMVGMKPSSPGSDAGPAAAAGPPSGAAVVTSALHRSGEDTGDDQL